MWLENKNSLKNSNDLRNSFRMDMDSYKFKKYFPKYNDAYSNFLEDSKKAFKKHGKIKENKLKLSKRINDIKSKRKKLNINKEEFKNNKNFNDNFTNRKLKDKNKIIKKNGLVSFSNVKLSNIHTNINEFENLYSNKTIQSDQYSSLDIAFLLHPQYFLKKNNKLEQSLEYKNILKEIDNLNF
jgi:hypothetical protein